MPVEHPSELEEWEYFGVSLWGKAIPQTKTLAVHYHDKPYTFSYIDLSP